FGRVLEGHGTGNLERHFRRVDIVVRPVVQLDLHIVDGIAREYAAGQRFLDPLVDGLDVFHGNRTAYDAFLDGVNGARRAGMKVDLRVTVLTAPTRLPDVTSFAVCRARQRFLVGDLRLADARLDVELALQAVDEDFEVQLAHAGNHRLRRLLVGADLEGGILGHQLLQPLAELLLVGFRLGLDGKGDDRLGELHRLEADRGFLVANRVPG